MAQPFYLALNLPGTVSAGAYSAGVIDFLVDAMDAWYAERDRCRAQFDENYDQWTIPPHELQLAVMAGASGGGITAALTAAALNQTFGHIHSQHASDNSALNPLFQSWVVDIDLAGLLGHADLEAQSARMRAPRQAKEPAAPRGARLTPRPFCAISSIASGGIARSLLDATPIREIAAQAFQITAPLPQRRPWVRDGLKVILTLTNLRGIPYAVEPQTDDESARALYFADRQEFALFWNQPQGPGSTALPLYPDGAGAWPELANAAIATSAFPIVLAAQKLNRNAGEYNHRHWKISNDDPKCGQEGICICETDQPMPPVWPLRADDSAPFETLNVDGGVTNNSPGNCARLELAGLPPAQTSGHNQRSAQNADRALIHIAPLAYAVPPELPPAPNESLLQLPFELIDLLVNQSRIQGEDLKLTANPNVFSRWVISPTTDLSAVEPLAGSLLGAFGAFVSQRFREHDYQLGRRNCQRFLMNYFGVPWNNVVLSQYGLSQDTERRLDSTYGFPADGNPSLRLCPLIPVVPSLRSPIVVNREPISADDLIPLAESAVDRLKRVAKALLAQGGATLVTQIGFDALWFFVKDKLGDQLLTYAGRELARHGFVD